MEGRSIWNFVKLEACKQILSSENSPFSSTYLEATAPRKLLDLAIEAMDPRPAPPTTHSGIWGIELLHVPRTNRNPDSMKSGFI